MNSHCPLDWHRKSFPLQRPPCQSLNGILWNQVLDKALGKEANKSRRWWYLHIIQSPKSRSWSPADTTALTASFYSYPTEYVSSHSSDVKLWPEFSSLLFVSSTISLGKGKNLKMQNWMCIFSVLGKKETLDSGPVEKELQFFFH